MESRDKRPLVPQLEEDILEAVWMDEMQIKNCLSKTYNSIRSFAKVILEISFLYFNSTKLVVIKIFSGIECDFVCMEALEN